MDHVGLLVNIGFANNPKINQRAVSAIVQMLSTHLGSSPRHVFLTIEPRSSTTDDLVERRIRWDTARDQVSQAIDEITKDRLPAKCLRLDAMLSKTAGSQSRQWLFDIACKWEANDDHVMPGYATLYMSESNLHAVTDWKAVLSSLVGTLETVGSIATGIGSIENASGCLQGDMFCSSAPGESDAVRFASRRLWADDILAGRMRIYQPAWCMILGSTVYTPSQRTELEAWAGRPGRLQHEKEWLASTVGGSLILASGPRPLESVTDIFEANGEALYGACRVLRKNGLLS